MAHYKHGKDYYADTAFLNALNRVKGLNGSLEHMGFGEFVWKSRDGGEVDFDRMRGKDFPGQSGRSHKMYDNKKGKLVTAMIKAMEKQDLSKLAEEAEAWSSPVLAEARKLAGITPKYVFNEAEPAQAQRSRMANVQTFLMILKSKLISQDRRDEKKHSNIYRLGHYMKALTNVENDMKHWLAVGSDEALNAFKKSLKRRFAHDFPPAKYVSKKMDKFMKDGKTPTWR
jgi:hypothetical protein